MQRLNILSLVISICLALPLTANASDFDWLSELDVKARANLTNFKLTLGTRFKIGDAQIKLVLSAVNKPADSYMVLRLSELSHRSVDNVLKVYKTDNGSGWGVMARDLGIKPGSPAFHALKNGHDLAYNNNDHGQARGKGKHQDRGKHKG
jgi:hypothetical protein